MSSTSLSSPSLLSLSLSTLFHSSKTNKEQKKRFYLREALAWPEDEEEVEEARAREEEEEKGPPLSSA